MATLTLTLLTCSRQASGGRTTFGALAAILDSTWGSSQAADVQPARAADVQPAQFGQLICSPPWAAVVQPALAMVEAVAFDFLVGKQAGRIRSKRMGTSSLALTPSSQSDSGCQDG